MAGIPVLFSVGNYMSAAPDTPMVLALTRMLRDLVYTAPVRVLSRGYGGLLHGPVGSIPDRHAAFIR